MSKPWFFQFMGDEVGPLPAAELKRRVVKGEIQPDTPVRCGRNGNWRDAIEIKGLFPEPEPAKPPPEMADLPPEKQSESGTEVVFQEIPVEPDGEDDPHKEYEFFDLVGFEQAITHKLFDEVQVYLSREKLTMTEAVRMALAEFIGQPELGQDEEETSDVEEGGEPEAQEENAESEAVDTETTEN